MVYFTIKSGHDVAQVLKEKARNWIQNLQQKKEVNYQECPWKKKDNVLLMKKHLELSEPKFYFFWIEKSHPEPVTLIGNYFKELRKL